MHLMHRMPPPGYPGGPNIACILMHFVLFLPVWREGDSGSRWTDSNAFSKCPKYSVLVGCQATSRVCLCVRHVEI